MAFAASSFGATHYRWSGRPGGVPIVFSNSLGTDLSIWDGVADALGARYRLVTHDSRGHGLTSVPPAPYRLEELSADLLELVDALGLDRFVLVGVSVGGLIAQRFALDHPERLAALVLCDTAAKIGDDDTWNGRINAVRIGGMAAIADAVLLRWFPAAIREGRDAEMEGWRNLLLRTPVEGYAGTCGALLDADLTDDVSTIAVPTLVVVGAEDQATPVALVRATAERIPGARFEILERAGHIPSIDQPAALAALIHHYIEEHVHG